MITGLIIAWLRRYFSLRTISILLILAGIILFIIGMFTYYFWTQNSSLFIVHGIIASALFGIGIIFLFIDFRRRKNSKETLKLMGLKAEKEYHESFMDKTKKNIDMTKDDFDVKKTNIKSTKSKTKDITKKTLDTTNKKVTKNKK